MESKNSKIKIETDSIEIGSRVDRYLANLQEIGSRSRADFLIEAGLVLVNGKKIKNSYKLKASDLLEITIPTETKSSPLKKMDLPLEIIYEDSDLIVVNKPVGLVVHPAPGHPEDTLVNALLSHTTDLSMKFGEERPGIVHRIDKETSGLLVVAKNDFAHAGLTNQFKNRTSHRIYYALCIGKSPKTEGRIQSFIARHPTDRKKFASVRNLSKTIITSQEEAPAVGKWAVTNYWVNKRIPAGLTLFKLKLETGRTHQIRVHLSELGCPIAGDELYGSTKKISSVDNKSFQKILHELPHFFLHAAELGFVHPRTDERLEFKVDWPQGSTEYLKSLGAL